MNMLLKHFKGLISSDAGQVVTRQQFFVTFSSTSLDFPQDLGLYVQNFDLPNLSLDEEGATTIKNPRGTAQVPGDGLIIPESNSFMIEFLETEIPVIESIFVPWLEQVVNIRSSNEYPFPRAIVRVDLLSAVNPEDIILTYTFYGAYPTLITLPSLTQAPADSISRPITFAFDKTKVEWNKNKRAQKSNVITAPKKEKAFDDLPKPKQPESAPKKEKAFDDLPKPKQPEDNSNIFSKTFESIHNIVKKHPANNPFNINNVIDNIQIVARNLHTVTKVNEPITPKRHTLHLANVTDFNDIIVDSSKQAKKIKRPTPTITPKISIANKQIDWRTVEQVAREQAKK